MTATEMIIEMNAANFIGRATLCVIKTSCPLA